ncbi:matrixin family metalloprotease [Flavobacterium gelatinilyticum]|uniref:matrixin family metalloprotease n=1 Tax=Flavobacterium gelatinilyticum TaxID=3003260 RepID=UPI0024803C3C|nr:matrixin family metalloprotease [Flavobacterium gelatinilyticum]
MKKILLFFGIILLVSCSKDRIEEIKNEGGGSSDEYQLCLTETDSASVAPSLTGRVSYKENRWENGQTIRIKFLNGNKFLQNKVKQFANEWTEYANLKFEWVETDEDADIKIGFKWKNNRGSWSTIGNNCQNVAQDNASMNFGWFDANTSDTEFSRTTIHEFGHALGLAHEHMSPFIKIEWNKPVVYAHYAKQGWNEKKVDFNVFSQLDPSKADYSLFDNQSIMLYFFSPDFTLNKLKFPKNTILSTMDKEGIAAMYPKPTISTLREKGILKAGESLTSENKRFSLEMRLDGNLVISDLRYNFKKVIWDTGTFGKSGASAYMLANGNLIVYKLGKYLWESKTSNQPGAVAVMQNNGNLDIILDGKTVWSSNSAQN